jgi:predicted MFS family arabinose efflux permease
MASVLTGYLVQAAGWNLPFLIVAGLSVVAALLFLWIDAGRPLIRPA